MKNIGELPLGLELRIQLIRESRAHSTKTLLSYIPESPKAFKLAFAVLVLAWALAATWVDSGSTLSGTDLWGIVLYGASVNAVLLGSALLIPRSRLVTNALLALVVLGGVIVVHLVHTDLSFPGNRNTLVVVCAAAGYALFIAFRVIDERREGGVVFSVLAILGIGASIGTSPPPTEVPTSMSIAWDIRPVEFQETPNLYFISFDSIVPRVLMQKYSGIEDTEFHRTFDRHFRRFPNFFSNAAPTKVSLNAVLALDMETLEDILRTVGWDHLSLFSGHQPSPLSAILRKNGYVVSTAYANEYLGIPGREKGPNVDRYHVMSAHTICPILEDSKETTMRVAFWGYCMFSKKMGWWDSELNNQRLVDLVKEKFDNKRPQFMMTHFYLPGHTNLAFRYNDETARRQFKQWYTARINHARVYLEEIVSHLKTNDPNAILLVYGDHGPFLSRHVSVETDAVFVIQDHFGVLGGIYPRDRCAASFDEASSQGYMTVLDAVHGLLHCLSGGKSARIESRKYSPRGEYKGTPWLFRDIEYDYGDFVYE